MNFTKRRNFNLREYWIQSAAAIEPTLRFQSGADFAAWHAQALDKLRELCCEFPQPVDPDVEVEYSVIDGDIVRERVVFNTEEFLSVPCIVLYPKDMPKNGKNAAIVCSHGHGSSGKNAICGHRDCSATVDDIEAMNYDYALTMAKAGFLTIAPDLRGFGERKDNDISWHGRDFCNVNMLRGMLLNRYPLTGNIWDIMRCIDYLQTRSEVDPERIGMMGLSGGGTMTTFTSALEPRIKAADIMGYVNSWKAFGIDRANFCGMQILPGILRWLDVDDIAGLIAPRPLLLEIGMFDNCFYLQDYMRAYEHLQLIYGAAGVPDHLEADIFPGPHAFGGNKAEAFFKKHL